VVAGLIASFPSESYAVTCIPFVIFGQSDFEGERLGRR
jgi:hypothetical protein